MTEYQTALRDHLAAYKVQRLGVYEPGIYERTGKAYPHILPKPLLALNFLEAVRAEVLAYLAAHPEIRLHRDFHHLNSSQALTLNLFFPYFDAGGWTANVLAKALGAGSDVVAWQFEHVPDRAEGTNVDVAWKSSDGRWTFCEVKLSESDFGAVEPDAAHCEKLESTYRPRLAALIDPSLLEPKEFCRHYQLLRNISFLSRGEVRSVVFLLPAANGHLAASLHRVLDALVPEAGARVHVAALEGVIDALRGSRELPAELRSYASSLAEKYLPDVSGSRPQAPECPSAPG